jgi:hypothetical protein
MPPSYLTGRAGPDLMTIIVLGTGDRNPELTA